MDTIPSSSKYVNKWKPDSMYSNKSRNRISNSYQVTETKLGIKTQDLFQTGQPSHFLCTVIGHLLFKWTKTSSHNLKVPEGHCGTGGYSCTFFCQKLRPLSKSSGSPVSQEVQWLLRSVSIRPYEYCCLISSGKWYFWPWVIIHMNKSNNQSRSRSPRSPSEITAKGAPCHNQLGNQLVPPFRWLAIGK